MSLKIIAINQEQLDEQLNETKDFCSTKYSINKDSSYDQILPFLTNTLSTNVDSSIFLKYKGYHHICYYDSNNDGIPTFDAPGKLILPNDDGWCRIIFDDCSHIHVVLLGEGEERNEHTFDSNGYYELNNENSEWIKIHEFDKEKEFFSSKFEKLRYDLSCRYFKDEDYHSVREIINEILLNSNDYKVIKYNENDLINNVNLYGDNIKQESMNESTKIDDYQQTEKSDENKYDESTQKSEENIEKSEENIEKSEENKYEENKEISEENIDDLPEKKELTEEILQEEEPPMKKSLEGRIYHSIQHENGNISFEEVNNDDILYDNENNTEYPNMISEDKNISTQSEIIDGCKDNNENQKLNNNSQENDEITNIELSNEYIDDKNINKTSNETSNIDITDETQTDVIHMEQNEVFEVVRVETISTSIEETNNLQNEEKEVNEKIEGSSNIFVSLLSSYVKGNLDQEDHKLDEEKEEQGEINPPEDQNYSIDQSVIDNNIINKQEDIKVIIYTKYSHIHIWDSGHDSAWPGIPTKYDDDQWNRIDLNVESFQCKGNNDGLEESDTYQVNEPGTYYLTEVDLHKD